ncbi:Hypothetical_protein [Hexamita inflata]|uniref:Hypothetical_protein n=1 Tax=Hexamita inflata TaxID=28002 RepID=A0AA86NYK7_9EUKA|nr:Hypothetical protein HINF_LOCUS14754 [Hexamita inflata]
MYRKKVVQRGEKQSKIDVEKIFDYIHEKGMMKATQSTIKEAMPAKSKQTLKNFEKAHKTKTKKKSTQTAEKGNNKLEDTSNAEAQSENEKKTKVSQKAVSQKPSLKLIEPLYHSFT